MVGALSYNYEFVIEMV